jgi:hypothetical protein
MTGLFVGLLFGLAQKIKAVKENKILFTVFIIASGLLGYIPEYIFTIWDLVYIVGLPIEVVLTILIKAWIEIAAISILMAVILNIPYIKDQLERLVGSKIKLSAYDYLLSAIITIPIFSITLYIASLGSIIPIDPWNIKPEVFNLILWVCMIAEIVLIVAMVSYYIYRKKTKQKVEK